MGVRESTRPCPPPEVGATSRTRRTDGGVIVPAEVATGDVSVAQDKSRETLRFFRSRGLENARAEKLIYRTAKRSNSLPEVSRRMGIEQSRPDIYLGKELSSRTTGDSCAASYSGDDPNSSSSFHPLRVGIPCARRGRIKMPSNVAVYFTTSIEISGGSRRGLTVTVSSALISNVRPAELSRQANR